MIDPAINEALIEFPFTENVMTEGLHVPMET